MHRGPRRCRPRNTLHKVAGPNDPTHSVLCRMRQHSLTWWRKLLQASRTGDLALEALTTTQVKAGKHTRHTRFGQNNPTRSKERDHTRLPCGRELTGRPGAEDTEHHARAGHETQLSQTHGADRPDSLYSQRDAAINRHTLTLRREMHRVADG